ncbi:MAG: hypothetical protein KGM42_01285 [Hyphomicrobiales bacterium]|nr:hypothetical protein [Hyphomicrobiales bacterium]
MSLRRSSFGLLLFLLALTSRAITPFAMMQLGFDPLAAAPICSQGDGAHDAPRDGGVPLAQDQHCAYACCQVFVAATDSVASSAPVIVAYVLPWNSARASAPPPAPALAYVARGPPVFS